MDLQLLARIVDRCHSFHETLDNVQFIKERQLDRNARQVFFGKSRCWSWDEFPVTPEVDHLLDAIRAVDCERGENGEIKDQDEPVKRIELVKRADVAPRLIDRSWK